MTSSSTTEQRPALPAWAHVSPARRAHIERVVALLDAWARAIDVDAAERQRWVRAGYLHDALKDAPADMLRALGDLDVPTSSLWHGPAAARRAQADGLSDQGVLDAVRYHSIGYAAWDRVGRMLYMADYLEPGRDKHIPHRDDWARRVPTEPDAVLRLVAQHRVHRTVASGRRLLPQTVEFWNSLV